MKLSKCSVGDVIKFENGEIAYIDNIFHGYSLYRYKIIFENREIMLINTNDIEIEHLGQGYVETKIKVNNAK